MMQVVKPLFKDTNEIFRNILNKMLHGDRDKKEANV